MIPGFQGVADDGRVATLGRGGSDTSAVALAAAMKADRCDIYTDVDGVYTTDPRIVPRARKLDRVTYEEMLELASVGAKVLQTRSVGLAMRENVPLQVLSVFEDRARARMIVGEEEIEDRIWKASSSPASPHDKNEARITLTGVADKPGAVAAIFAPLAEAGINVDMIVQNVAHATRLDRPHLHRARGRPARRRWPCSRRRKDAIGYARSDPRHRVAKVSSSASACAATPASPRRCSRRWPSADQHPGDLDLARSRSAC